MQSEVLQTLSEKKSSGTDKSFMNFHRKVYLMYVTLQFNFSDIVISELNLNALYIKIWKTSITFNVRTLKT